LRAKHTHKSINQASKKLKRGPVRMTVLSFKQVVLKEGGVKKEKAPAKNQQPKLRSSHKSKSNNHGDSDANANAIGVAVVAAATAGIRGSEAVVSDSGTPESLVLLKLRCVHRRGASQSQSTNSNSNSTTNGSEDSDDTSDDFVALDGPVADECYVEAKLLDVSSSSSTSRCVTDSDSEGSREASRGMKAIQGMSSSNSSCAIYYEDTDDNYSDSTTNVAMTMTRSSTPEANANANKGKDSKNDTDASRGAGGEKKPIKKEGDDGNKKKLYIKIPETPSLVAPAQGQAQVYTPLGSVASPPGFTIHTPNEYNFVYPNTPHQKVTIELDCPQALVGRLIGKNGSTVRNLELKTGVSIQIDQSLPDGCPRRVKICGHPQLIDHAERIVEEVIKHGPPELNKRNVYKMELNAIAYEQAQANPAKRNLFAKVFKQMQGPHAATSFATTTTPKGQQRHQRKKVNNNAATMNNPSPPQTYYPVGLAPDGIGEYEAVAPLHGAPGFLPVPHYTVPYANNMYTLPEMYASPAAQYIPQVVKPRSFKVYATAALAAGRFWSQHQSPTGQKYFINHVTGKVTNLEDD
jgi:hypothetical protein